MKKTIKLKTVIAVLVPLSLFSLIAAVCLGPVSVSPATTFKVILGKLSFLGAADAGYSALEESIVWNLRLPRVLLGFIVGASLAVCGVSMQALIRNRLADPFVLGVSSGASATASLFMVLGTFSFMGRYSLAFTAFLGAAASVALVYALSRVRGRINVTQLLLAGVAVAMIMDAVTKTISLGAPNALAVHNLDFWMTGSLAGAKWGYLTLPLVVMLLCLGYLMINYRTLNALLLGDEAAGTLGVNVARTQKTLMLISSLLAGVTISVSGSIGFVGLMIPHICRLLVGNNHKRVLPLCVLLGGLLVVWTDVAARLLLAPEELPVGILTALIGGPSFIILLKSKAGRSW